MRTHDVPLVGIPEAIAQGIAAYRSVLCRDAGFEHVSRYVNGLEVFNEFCKQVAGFEAAQLRNEKAVKRHFCLRCLAQSLLYQAPLAGKTSERYDAWANIVMASPARP